MLSKLTKIEKIKCTYEDSENIVFVGDETVIDRLNEILDKIKNGEYSEETKNEIYYQNEKFVLEDDEEESACAADLNETVKYYISGWWLHSLYNMDLNATNNACKIEQKTDKSVVENKQ